MPPKEPRVYEDTTIISMCPAPPGTRLQWAADDPVLAPVYWMAVVEVQMRICHGEVNAGEPWGSMVQLIRPVALCDYLDPVDANCWEDGETALAYPRLLLPHQAGPVRGEA